MQSKTGTVLEEDPESEEEDMEGDGELEAVTPA
jgi:hypothetical protein